jgi:hypothetical protein
MTLCKCNKMIKIGALKKLGNLSTSVSLCCDVAVTAFVPIEIVEVRYDDWNR